MKPDGAFPLKPHARPLDAAARIKAIRQNPNFRRLASIRARLGLSMAALMATLYFAYILTVALKPSALGTPVLPDAVSTWGIVAGAGLLGLGFVLTAVYVAVANRTFDRLTETLKEDVQ